MASKHIFQEVLFDLARLTGYAILLLLITNLAAGQ
jgi:hypothetical protein